MKIEFKKYAFEIVVIFIGITVSFLFDGWRKEKEENQMIKEQMVLLTNDFTRVNSWIDQIDSQYMEQISAISNFRNGTETSEEDLAGMFWSLDFDAMNFPVRELSPYLTKISKLSETTGISNSEEIITISTYVTTLTRVDYEESQIVANYVSEEVWSKLYNHNFLDRVLDCEKEFSDSIINWQPKQYTIDMFPDLYANLTFIELKLRRILNVHSALKARIEDLKIELEKI